MEKGVPGNVISLVGPANSGKTQAICRLVAWLREQGYRSAVLKHSHHVSPAVSPGAEICRRAGGEILAVATQGALQVNRMLPGEPDLHWLLACLSPLVDVVLVEGYKRSSLPKILLVGPGLEDVLPRRHGVVAYLSQAALEGPLPTFHPQDVAGLGRFILSRCGLKPSPPALI